MELRISSAADQREQVDVLNDVAWSLVTEDPEQAYKLAQRAHELAQNGEFSEQSYQRGVIESSCTQVRLRFLRGETETALEQSLHTLKAAEDLQDSRLLLRVLFNLTLVHYQLGNYSDVLGICFRRLALAEELDDTQDQAKVFVGLGATYSSLGEQEKALTYFEKSLAIFRELEDFAGLSLTLTNIALVYFDLDLPQRALTYVQEALELCRKHTITPRNYMFALNTLGSLRLKMGEGEAARTHFEESLKLAREVRQPEFEADSLFLLGKLFLQLEQPGKAIPYFQDALEMAQQLDYRQRVFRAHEKLAQAFQDLGDFEPALIHYKEFHAIKESVFSAESDTAIKNIEIRQRTKAVRQEADLYASLYEEEQARRLLAETLYQVGTALANTLDLQVVLEKILEQLDLVVHSDRSSLLLLQDQKLEFVALRGFPVVEDYLQQHVPLTLENPDDVFLRIYRSKQPLVLNDLATYQGWQQVKGLPLPRSWLGVPLMRQDKVIGLLSLVRETAVSFTNEDIQIATTFAASAAVALENARLYDEVKRFSAQLEYEVKQRTDAVLSAYEQLERLDRAKSDFIDVTAHELRTPLTVVKGYSQLLLHDTTITEEERLHRLIKGIVAGANRLHEIVNTMLTMVKIDNRTLAIYAEPLDMIEVLETALEDLKEPLAARRQKLFLDASLANLPQISADQDALTTVFEQLLVNAIKYTPDGGKIFVNGRSWQEPPNDHLPPEAIEIVIRDSGIGIEADALELIFTKFYQTGSVSLHSSGKTKFKAGGPGLGLAIARGIINAHRGQIWAESAGYDEEKMPGSEFHVVLPINGVPMNGDR